MKNIKIVGVWFRKQGFLNSNNIKKSTLFFMLLFVATTFAQTTVSKQITNGDDDAEQNVSGGAMSLGSSDLEMTVDLNSGQRQIVGMRFRNLSVPQAATVSNAYIQFEADKDTSGIVNLTAEGQNIDDAPIFLDVNNNMNSRFNQKKNEAYLFTKK